MGVDSSDEESEQDRHHHDHNGHTAGNFSEMAVEKLQWETLRSEMTIAEINAERGFGTIGSIENPEEDSSSSDEDVARGGVGSGGGGGGGGVSDVAQTQEELDFYKSLMKPATPPTMEPVAKVTKAAKGNEASPLVRAMMASTVEESPFDERWLAIDQEEEYMKEYERELRRSLQEEVGSPIRN